MSDVPPTKAKFDIFISHNWGMDGEHRDNHKRVNRLNEALRAANLTTWIDEEHQSSSGPASFQQSMSAGIDASRKVLICITKRYMDKVAGKMGANDSCRKEFEYSARRKGLDHIIPVVMEKQCENVEEWYGPLGLSLANSQCLDFTANANLSECVRDIVKHLSDEQGRREITTEEGTYVGAMNDKGERHGFGSMKYVNGDYYEGPWENDKRHGVNGKLEYFQKSPKSPAKKDQDKGGQQPLAVYEGSFFNDQKHGTGKLTMRNGDVYEGGYVKNHKEGKGKFVAKNKSEVYEGDWKQGNRHGSGTLIDSKGDVYIGEFRVNKICGKGKKNYKDGRVYNGEWKDGKRVGKGKMRDKNNNEYIGDWINDKRHGHGILKYKSEDEYTGDFKNGMIDGLGKTKYKNGSVYEGEYRKNKKHGKGKYTFSDGHQYYNGEWKNNKRHGHGLRLYKSGDIYEGGFVNNMREGQGTIMIKETGIVYQGTWLADKMHGSGFCIVENNDNVTMKVKKKGWFKKLFSKKNVKQVKVEFDNNSLQSSKPVKERKKNADQVSLPDELLAVKYQEEQSIGTAANYDNVDM